MDPSWVRPRSLGILVLWCLSAGAASGHIQQLIPNQTTAGAPGFLLIIKGVDLEASEQILWNGAQIPSIFVDATEKRVQVPASLISQSLYPNGGEVTVTLVAEGGNSLRLRINSPLLITTPVLPDGVVGATYSFALSQFGGTAPFTWSGTPPPGMSFSPAGVLSGRPTTAATFTFTAQVRDAANATVSRAFSLLVRAVNAPPVAVDDAYAVSNSSFLIPGDPIPSLTLTVPAPGVLRNDTDPEGVPLTAVLESGPSNGSVTLNPDGSFTYKSNPRFIGQDSFRYRARDELQVSATAATVRITVVFEGSASCEINPSNTVAYSLGVELHIPATVRVRLGGVPLSGAVVYSPLRGGGDTTFGPTNADGEVGIFFTIPATAEEELTFDAYSGLGVTSLTFRCTAKVTAQLSPVAGFGTFCLLPLVLRATATEPKADEQGLLVLFRRLRDQVLARTGLGQEYTREYYRFAPELGRIVLSDPILIWRAREKLQQFSALVQALVSGRSAMADEAELKEIAELVRSLEDRAGRELRAFLQKFQRDFLDPKVLANFGVTIRETLNADSRSRLREAYGKLPLSFEVDPGQAGRSVNYQARGAGYNVYLQAAEAVLALDSGAARNHPVVRMQVVGARKAAQATGLSPLPGASNYLIGGDPKRWRTGLRRYAKVKYDNIYPGIDLVYYGHQNQLEYDFVVAPGAVPERIALTFRGLERMEIENSGDVKLSHAGGNLYLRRPFLYQEIAGVRRQVAGEYVLRSANRIGFHVGEYDARRPLIIDPVLSYASYLGGSGLESSMSTAVDSNGNGYITGATTSANFATRAPLQQRFAGGGDFRADGFVTKFDATGSSVLYSTYFGGSNDDIGMGIAVDAQGNAYVTGATRSADFPTVQPIQRAFGGGSGTFKTDAFLLKLDPTGSRLIYSTYLGGSGDDGARGVAVDTAGNAYVAGATASIDFPVVGAVQRVNGGGQRFRSDAFAAKVNASGTALLYSTYLGGDGDDAGVAITVDASGNGYLTGATYSSNFPLVSPLQRTYGGSADVFVSKLNPAGSALLYSTYLGGKNDDISTAIAVDAQGNAHVAGFTGSSSDFPKVNAAQPRFGNADGLGFDAFVAKLNPAGSALLYSTFLGGNGRDFAFGLALDSQGSAFVVGETDSKDFSTPTALYPASGGKLDGFIAKLNPAGSLFEYRSYLGGSEDDSALAVAVDRSGAAYIAGSSSSTDAPASFGAFQSGLQGLLDGWVVKVGPGAPAPTITTVSAASLVASSGVAPDSFASGFGEGLSATTTVATVQPYPTVLAGTTVTVKDSGGVERFAPLVLVSPGQINYLVPTGAQPGLALVTVTTNGRVVATGTARVYPVAPTLFAANSNGKGAAAALWLRVAPDGSRTSELVFRCGAAPGSCTSNPIDLGSQNEQVFLLLFGTGIRAFTTEATVTAGGQKVPVLSASAQGEFAGLDQVNIGPLPRSLAGRGEIDIVLTVDGVAANKVIVNIR